MCVVPFIVSVQVLKYKRTRYNRNGAQLVTRGQKQLATN